MSEIQKALIYCRVSSAKQKTSGGGLESQEHRCREYARLRGYEVEAVFPDDISGSADFMTRPGMRAMLAYLDGQIGKQYVVIFDDLKRFARDTELHFQLRREFSSRGASVECLNFKFEDTPEGKFIETVIAAQGALEREQNRRQVIQKMKARVEAGFWVFRAPVGYKFERASTGGKVLVPDEPLASVVKDVLEGYASGRLASQAEVQRFLEADPHFPKDRPIGSLRAMTVWRLLRKVVYAGHVEAPKWGVSVRQGQHEGLISFATFERIQDLLEGKRRPAARKDFNEDFPVRGFVMCGDCGKPMTAAFSKGKYKHYPYYLCDTRGCPSKRKSIPRAKIEDGISDLLKTLQPTRQLFDIARQMFLDAWQLRLDIAADARAGWKRQIADVTKQMDNLLDRIVDASSPTVVSAYETRLTKLERQKLVLTEKADSALPPKGHLEDFIELSLRFLSSPWEIYDKGCPVVKRAVLKLAFSEPLHYTRNDGYRTPKTTLPFKVLGGLNGHFGEMVHLRLKI
jgi:DNA invertase Pin-like site-specific DNA recombinase